MAVAEDLKAPIKTFALATFSHGDNVAVGVKCDRLAHDGNKLMIISVVAEPSRIKAIRAILHAKSGSPQIKVEGVFTKHSSAGDVARQKPGNLVIDKEGYETYAHRMDYGLSHAVFMSKSEDFIRYLSPEAIWRKLNTARFTTPMLEEWMPYITAKLIEQKFLRECSCFRANCGVLDTIAEDKLDSIVSEGIKSGRLWIP
jgi:hypothetical protein